MSDNKNYKLTPKQEKFCQNIINGMNYSDAYRNSYDTSNCNMASINRCAFALFNNVKIASRIAELKEKIQKEIVYSAVDSFNKLSEIQEKALNAKKYSVVSGKKIELDDPDFNSAIKAEELKGKLAQLYVDKKDISFSGDMKERADEIRRKLFENN